MQGVALWGGGLFVLCLIIGVSSGNDLGSVLLWASILGGSVAGIGLMATAVETVRNETMEVFIDSASGAVVNQVALEYARKRGYGVPPIQNYGDRQKMISPSKMNIADVAVRADESRQSYIAKCSVPISRLSSDGRSWESDLTRYMFYLELTFRSGAWVIREVGANQY